VFSAAITILFVVSEFWINATAPDGRRGFVMGIYATVLSAGFAAGPAVLAAFGSDSLIPFAATALAFALAALPVTLGGAIAPRIETRPSQRLLAFLLVAPSAVLAAFVFGAGESTMFAFMALFGLRSGLEETSAALLITMAGLGNMLFQIPIGLLADRMNRTLVLAVCGLVGFAGAAALPFVIGTPWAAFSVMFVWGGLAAGLYTVGLTQLGARFSGADLAAANALFVMLYSFGMLVGPAAAGAAMDFHVNGLPAVLAAFFGLYAIVAWARWIIRERSL
jgi:MFS family permease